MEHVILAAGIAKRLKPLTLTQSKAMIPIANKPILEWTLDSLTRDTLVVVRRDQKDVIDYFQGRCDFIYQDQARGTAHALSQVKDYVNGTFLAMNVDELITQNDMDSLKKLKEPHIACHPSEHPELYATLEISQGKIMNIEEKPAKPKNNLVNSGIYVFDERLFPALKSVKPSSRGELEITDAIRFMISENVNVAPFILQEWKTITYPWNLLDANAFILDQHGSQISDDAEIRNGAYIEGPVAIGPGAVVGPNCYVRKYSSIGANCKVGNAVEIKNSIIMEHSYVSHLSYVGDSIVGRNCNIAAGTIFANLRLDDKTVKMQIEENKIDSGHRKLGSIVGDNVKFGVNVTVMPGKRIWPNLLVPPGMAIEEDLIEQPEIGKSRK